MPKLFFRSATLEAGSDVSTTGKVKLSFASELPVLRRDKSGEYWEVLSHSPGDANLGLINRSGVVLQDHDDKLEIGDVVRKSAHVDSDKKTRAEINIFDGEWVTRAKKDWANIPVSVGYERLTVLEETTGEDDIQLRRYSWRPYEISLLTVAPADDTVGINRAKRNVKRICPECSGTGRCRCRSKDEDKADEECGRCSGNGRCADCGGDGNYESARKGVDSIKTANAAQILEVLTTEQKNDMQRMLLASDSAAGHADADTVERNRRKEIMERADAAIKDHGAKNSGAMQDEIVALARECVEKKEHLDTFTFRLWEKITSAKPAKPIGIADVTSEREREEYSFGQAIKNVYMQRANGGGFIPDSKTIEGKVHFRLLEEANSNKTGGLGFTPGGFLVPHDVAVSNKTVSSRTLRALGRPVRSQRDMQVDIFGQGGAMVPTVLVVPIIELLRNMMVLDKVGVRHMGGLQGNIVIPRQTAPATAYSVSEIGALTGSNQTLDQIALTPKRVGVTQNYSKQLIFQSTPDVEAFLRDDQFKVIALQWDYYGFNGTGSASQPLGIINSPGIGGVTFGATPTYIKMVLFETTIRNANVMDEIAYVSTTATRGSLKTVAEALTGATTIGGRQNAIWQGGLMDGTVNFCQAIASNQIPGNLVVAGAFEHLIHAMWSGLDVVVDHFTLAPNAEVKITINTWGDFALRHPQAFCVSTDAGNQ